ncbi:PREDICTED: tctex1 domain-containing protein 1-A-like [Ceratosolen solmsi marchali]|uniref:Tctex1 domain-containing protein 1-A-like n=1 Tax=Ceratosolen solmsi marchali TaxID=326594 RepID=A0AAJ7E034_9HYME|nr:PREDICTED: tctex1 domain-containing protein 1-A-like [Ceratosolen solmsi marchali]
MKSIDKKTKSQKSDDRVSVPVSKASFSQNSRSKNRLSAVYFGNVPRTSQAWRKSIKNGFKVPMYQNSYWLDPYLPFRYEVSDKILKQVMTNRLKEEEYSEYTVNLSRSIAAEIHDQLYRTDYDRVKYVVIITIIENTDQSFSSVNGRLWDAQRDTYSVFIYDRPTFYAIGLVFAMYYE